MIQKITDRSLKRYIHDLVTINREGSDISGHLFYGGDIGTGGGDLAFLDPPGTGKFYIRAYNARRFGPYCGIDSEHRRMYHVDLKNGELITLPTYAPPRRKDPFIKRTYRRSCKVN